MAESPNPRSALDGCAKVACDLPNLCLLDNMREAAGLPIAKTPRPPDWDGRERWRCAEPVAYRLLTWELAEEREVPVCAVHALAAALHSIENTPKILGVKVVEAVVPFTLPDYQCHEVSPHDPHLHPVGKHDIERRCPGVPAQPSEDTRG